MSASLRRLGRAPTTALGCAALLLGFGLVARTAPAASDAAGRAHVTAMTGTRYPAGKRFVERYCAGCHTEAGADPQKRRAYAVLQLDTYEQWKGSQKVLTAVLDRWHLDGRLMPPPTARPQPTDAERRAALDWLRRGSPNTPDGR